MDWSYIAGYFDGEGSVNCYETARGDKSRAMSWFNTHEQSLRAMADFMGVGRISSRPERYAIGGYVSRKPAFVLTVSSKSEMLHVLDNIIPHLIIKRDKAEALRLHLIDHVDAGRMVNFGKVAAVQTAQLKAWYASGESHADIAKRLGVSRLSVLQAFRVRGIHTRTAAEGTALKTRGVPKSAETRARMVAAQRAHWADPAFVARQKELRAKRKADANLHS